MATKSWVKRGGGGVAQVLQALLARFLELGRQYHPPQRNPPVDVSGYCGAVSLNRNFVGPWMNQTNEQLMATV